MALGDGYDWFYSLMVGSFGSKRYRQENPDYMKTYFFCFPMDPVRLTCLYSLITLMVYLSMVHTFSLYSHCAKYLLIIGMIEVALKIACLWLMLVGLLKMRSYLLTPQLVIYYALSFASLLTCISSLVFYLTDCDGLMTSLFCRRITGGCESPTPIVTSACGIVFFYHAGRTLSKVYFNTLDFEDMRFDVDPIVCFSKDDKDASSSPDEPSAQPSN